MNSQKPKIAIIGAGSVGSTYAFSLMINGYAREIVLIDNNMLRATGEAADITQGISLAYPTSIYAAGFDGCKEADIVVITAGAKQKPGQTRIDLVNDNVRIFKEIIPRIIQYAPNTILLVVSNPVDILTYVALKLSGFPANRVIGSGTVLDTARLKYMISEHCRVDPRNVHAYIMGEHGDTEFPVWSNANVGGMPLEQFCSMTDPSCDFAADFADIFDKVKNAAYKIIEAKGATNYSIALSLVRITGAILRNENSILPISTLISDYYEINDVCMSIPSHVTRNGVEFFLRLDLSEKEISQFKHTAHTLKEVLKNVGF